MLAVTSHATTVVSRCQPTDASALTVPQPIVSRTWLSTVLSFDEFLINPFHELDQCFVDQWLIIENLGHCPETSNWTHVLRVPIFVLGIENV